MSVEIGQVYEDERKLAGCAVSSEFARFRVISMSRTRVTIAREADGVPQSVPIARLLRAPWKLVSDSAGGGR